MRDLNAHQIIRTLLGEQSFSCRRKEAGKQLACVQAFEGEGKEKPFFLVQPPRRPAGSPSNSCHVCLESNLLSVFEGFGRHVINSFIKN